MLNSKIINLREDGSAYLTTYIQEHNGEILNSGARPCVVVCPGGGYEWCSFREGEPVALEYVNKGFNAFVVNYSIQGNAKYPNSLVDLSRAIKMIRDNADEWHVIPDQIAVIGFSAGGHLTATCATLWNDKEVQEKADCLNDENKPNACMLIYPVISLGKFSHAGTRNAILSDYEGEKRQEVFEKLCTENQVGPHTPPCFIASTFDDDAVPIENSLMFADAMAKANRPFEMHVFRSGPHGLSTADTNSYNWEASYNPDFNKWVDLSVTWLYREFGIDNIAPLTKRPVNVEGRARGEEI